jgi:hypothetical protein
MTMDRNACTASGVEGLKSVPSCVLNTMRLTLQSMGCSSPTNLQTYHPSLAAGSSTSTVRQAAGGQIVRTYNHFGRCMGLSHASRMHGTLDLTCGHRRGCR